MSQNQNQFNANSARSLREKKRALGDNYDQFADDDLDDDFAKNARKTIKKSEEDQSVKKIQNQINYFGYMIEPLNMKNEREEKEIDEEGNYRFSWRKEKENSDAWLSQLDEDQYGFKMYFNTKNEKGVFSDDDYDDKNSDEEVQPKKKIKRNDQNAKGKFDDYQIYDLLKELTQTLEEGQKEIVDIMEVITPKKRMDQIKIKLEKNKKPVFPFKKNQRQAEKQEQENKLKEWENNRLSDAEEVRVKNSLEDLIDIIKDLEYKMEIATLWDTDLEMIKEMLQKEESKKKKQQTPEVEEEIAEEDDLKFIPKELLEKLENGTITEDEENEIKRLIMMAKMGRSQQEDSDDEELTTGRIQFDSDSDGEEDKPLPPINKVPLSQQNQVPLSQQNQVPLSQQNKVPLSQQNKEKEVQKQQFKVPEPVRRNSLPGPNQYIQQTPTVTMPPQNSTIFQKPNLSSIEEEIPDEKPKPNKKETDKPTILSQPMGEDDIDMFG